jgi:hypothetical protein
VTSARLLSCNGAMATANRFQHLLDAFNVALQNASLDVQHPQAFSVTTAGN